MRKTVAAAVCLTLSVNLYLMSVCESYWRLVPLVVLAIATLSLGCQPPAQKAQADNATPTAHTGIQGALLASRFQSLEELKAVVDIAYATDTTLSDSAAMESSTVTLTHVSNGYMVTSTLESGMSQADFKAARDGDFWDQAAVGFGSPYGVRNRKDLNRISILSRRMRLEFGVGDVAFFDLAELAVRHINTRELAFQQPRDKGEKGYLNSFNHITAQAFITTIFSEELADFIADVHERYNMPELTTGRFQPEQLTNPDNNPVDNYVDLINNEWGQELGKKLAEKHHIDRYTHWTPELLASYLNELQQYYSWAFGIGFKPCRATDPVIIRFADKINFVMQEEPIALK